MSYIVFKCGGSIVDQLPESFFETLANLKEEAGIEPVIVHGGGPMISDKLQALNVQSQFVDGLRVTTNDVLDVVEMVLSGAVNKKIVRKLSEYHHKIMGVSGVDADLLVAKQVASTGNIGYVGEVTDVNTGFIDTLTEAGYIPVISPLGMDQDQQRYNINADMAAASVASALGAPLCFISDIPGIMKNGEVLHHVTKKRIHALIEEGTIYGGMIPKVMSALSALDQGAKEVAIINGSDSKGLMAFVKGESIGTRITLNEVTYV